MSKLLIADFEADSIIGGGGDEWNLGWGTQLIHGHLARYADQQSRVLDVCCGMGRASYPFLVRGGEITGIDTDQECLDILDTMNGTFGSCIHTINGDVKYLVSYFPTARFDFVLLLDALVHQRKTDAYLILDQAIQLLNSGGRIYVDGPSTSNYQFEMMHKQGSQYVDRDTFLEICGCTGVMQFEPFCFFHPGEISAFLKARGMIIEHSYSDWFEYQSTKNVCIARKP